MKNLDLLFANVPEIISSSKRKSADTIKICNSSLIINSAELRSLMGKVKFFVRKYKYLNKEIIFCFKDNTSFKDEITIRMIDLIILYIYENSAFDVGLDFTLSNEYQYNYVVESSVFSICAKEGNLDKKNFYYHFYKTARFEKNEIRYFIKRDDMNIDRSTEIYDDVGTSLSFYLEEELSGNIAHVAAELFDNVYNHAKDGDCMINIFINEKLILKHDGEIYKGVILSVINLSKFNLGDSIKNAIVDEKYNLLDKTFSSIYAAYNNHKIHFDELYNENAFSMITSFQNKVSSRNLDSSNTGGTGLTNLIRTLSGQSDDQFTYVLSGTNIIVFNEKHLNVNEEGYVGFNEKNDYINQVPDKDVFDFSDLNIPGTIYQLVFYVKENGDVKKN